jgi:hypothetical protein
MRRAVLSDKGYSAKEEKRALDALGRGLLKEFPNPERLGCPGSELLRGVASHKVPLAQAEPWLNHLTSCSPCYRDFNQFREAYQRTRRRILLAVAASILVAATAGIWWVIRTQNEIQSTESAVLDLRNRSLTRGSDAVPDEPPLEIRRNVARMDIYLPFGSTEGPYEVRMVTTSGESIATTSGIAKLNNSITSLQVAVNLSRARPGPYVLQVRKAGSEWNSYPLLLR